MATAEEIEQAEKQLREAVEAFTRIASGGDHVAGWALLYGGADWEDPSRIAVGWYAPEDQMGLVTSGLVREMSIMQLSDPFDPVDDED